MADLLALSARIIDEGDLTERVNRLTGELSELADDVAVVEAFSHVIAFRTADGLVLFDTSVAGFGPRVLESLRAWAPDDPVHTMVYTHGHVDHVGGASVFVDEAAARGFPRPRVVAHENVPARFERYDLTNGYNAAINRRQFGRDMLTFFDEWVQPDLTYEASMDLSVGGLDMTLHHGRGETDDHTWTWIPSLRAITAGDFLIWAFPNAGNPQKVQRFPGEWARAMRDMAAMEPELYLPAHGLPVAGRDRITGVLDDVATALEGLVRDTLTLMNDGARLDQIVAEVRVPEALLAKPYLRPTYDEPEFVVRNIWRLYGGWWDGNPATLKPAPDAALASEIAALAGGALALAERGRALAAAGGDANLRLACHLVEHAALAAPDDAAVHAARAEVYEARRTTELSLMSRGIYADAAAQSHKISEHSDR
ncbi:MAG TPA: alkyl sulfatase dimerization domain-containing protein [Acidimicrobiales bacterium]|nr:alkyl sulfatase dimerization domain-containing protein [Acidimicrobiales bacterium]